MLLEFCEDVSIFILSQTAIPSTKACIKAALGPDGFQFHLIIGPQNIAAAVKKL